MLQVNTIKPKSQLLCGIRRNEHSFYYKHENFKFFSVRFSIFELLGKTQIVNEISKNLTVSTTAVHRPFIRDTDFEIWSIPSVRKSYFITNLQTFCPVKFLKIFLPIFNTKIWRKTISTKVPPGSEHLLKTWSTSRKVVDRKYVVML